MLAAVLQLLLQIFSALRLYHFKAKSIPDCCCLWLPIVMTAVLMLHHAVVELNTLNAHAMIILLEIN